MKAQGRVHKYGNNVDTDVIIPARHLNTQDHKELASHCMEDIDKDFINKVQQGDIMVAGDNFGCGSSREHAPIAIKAAGIDCVIANTFAASEKIEAGDEVEVDFDSGVIKNLTKGEEYKAHPFPESIQKIIKAGGLLNSIAEDNK